MKRKDFLTGFVGVSIGFSSGCLSAIGLASDEEINDTYVDGYDIFQKAENPANNARADLYKSAAATFTDAYRLSHEESRGRYADVASDAAWNAATKANVIETRRLNAPPVMNELVIETAEGDPIALPENYLSIMPSVFELERQRPVVAPEHANADGEAQPVHKYDSISTDYLELNYVNSQTELRETVSTDGIEPAGVQYSGSDERTVEEDIVYKYSYLLEGYRIFDSQFNSALVSLEYGDTLLAESEVASSKWTLPYTRTTARSTIQQIAYDTGYPLICAMAMELGRFENVGPALIDSQIGSINDSDQPHSSGSQSLTERKKRVESIPIPTVSLMMDILDVENRPSSIIRYIRSPSDETRDLPIDSIGGYTVRGR